MRDTFMNNDPQFLIMKTFRMEMIISPVNTASLFQRDNRNKGVLDIVRFLSQDVVWDRPILLLYLSTYTGPDRGIPAWQSNWSSCLLSAIYRQTGLHISRTLLVCFLCRRAHAHRPPATPSASDASRPPRHRRTWVRCKTTNFAECTLHLAERRGSCTTSKITATKFKITPLRFDDNRQYRKKRNAIRNETLQVHKTLRKKKQKKNRCYNYVCCVCSSVLSETVRIILVVTKVVCRRLFLYGTLRLFPLWCLVWCYYYT